MPEKINSYPAWSRIFCNHSRCNTTLTKALSKKLTAQINRQLAAGDCDFLLINSFWYCGAHLMRNLCHIYNISCCSYQGHLSWVDCFWRIPCYWGSTWRTVNEIMERPQSGVLSTKFQLEKNHRESFINTIHLSLLLLCKAVAFWVT